MEAEKCKCYVHENKKRSEEEKRALCNRLSRLEGQIRGIRGMIENDAYCPEVLTQTSAVAAAVSSFERELLSLHLHSCVAEDIRSGRDEMIDELMDLLRKMI